MPSTTFKIKNFKISSLNDFLKAFNKDKTILYYKDIGDNDVYLIACINGHLEIMKYLEKEHNWNIHIKATFYGRDAYLIASYNGHLEIMKYLEKEHNWDIHIRDEGLEDAYLLAIPHSHLEIMNYLEKKHNWEIYVENCEGENALILAIEYKHLNIVKYLVEKHNYNIYHRDNEGEDAYLRAFQKKEEIFNYLKKLIQKDKKIKQKQVDETKVLLKKNYELENEVKKLKTFREQVKRILLEKK